MRFVLRANSLDFDFMIPGPRFQVVSLTSELDAYLDSSFPSLGESPEAQVLSIEADDSQGAASGTEVRAGTQSIDALAVAPVPISIIAVASCRCMSSLFCFPLRRALSPSSSFPWPTRRKLTPSSPKSTLET